MNRESKLEARTSETQNAKMETRNWKLKARKWLMVWVTHRDALLSALAALVFTIAACSHPLGDFTPARLSADLEPLRADFNHDGGQIRLVLLVDPT